MRATFLGTGTGLPDGERGQSGLLVRDGERRLLVDCGSGVLERLVRAGTAPGDLDAVCLTHHHLDHVSDLMSLLNARWLADDGAASLPVVGPPGTVALIDDLRDVHAYLDGRVRVNPRDVTGSFSAGGFTVDVSETDHTDSMRSLAYRVGDALTVSGDTPADPDLAAFAAGTTLVHDCSFPDGGETDAHATPGELGRVLAGRDYRGVYLTHRSPDAEAAGEVLVASVRERYDGAVALAREGETIACGTNQE